MPEFCGPPLSHAGLILHLQEKGLMIPDQNKAEKSLIFIGYHRFSGYFDPFLESDGNFKKDTTFYSILELYHFDRRLRLLCFDPIARIEIALRSAICNTMACKYNNAYWYLERSLFDREDDFNNFKKQIDKEKKRQKIDLNVLLPSWKLSEILTMGCWSKLYQNLKDIHDKRAIADLFDFSWRDIGSWMQYLSLIRNNIAHHNKFYNSIIVYLPKNQGKYIHDAGLIGRAYLKFVVIVQALRQIDPDTEWPLHLRDYLVMCPVDIHQWMNFPKGWEELAFWQ